MASSAISRKVRKQNFSTSKNCRFDGKSRRKPFADTKQAYQQRHQSEKNVAFLRCTSCCCVRRHQERAASVPTVPKKDAIIERTMVVLQISANVTRTEHVTIVSTSWPAGNYIGEHSFKLKKIFVEVRVRSEHNLEFSRKTVARFVLAESLLTFMVAGTLHIDGMKTFPVDIIIFVL